MKKLTPGRLLKGALRLVTSKTIWFSLLAIVMTTTIFVMSYLDNVIYIIDGDDTSVTITNQRDPMQILAAEEIVTTANDKITFVAPTQDSEGQVVIQRGYPVRLAVDGEVITKNWLGGTVSDLLVLSGVTLGAHDKMTHELTDQLSPFETVQITRVAYRSYDVKVVLHKVVNKKSTSLIKLGTSRVISPGEDGLRIDTYDEILEDGVVVETVLGKSVVTKEPVEELMLVGDGSATSTLDYSGQYPLDENGVPTNYKAVLKTQRATGYYARGNRPYGSSGMYCQAGTVAVRSSQIPYGSKLYIRTPNGKFIYGYAVANDTGSALMEGIIDVDLYYETYIESALNEVRWVDIYILEYGVPGTKPPLESKYNKLY
ncbi:MAG: G5 domain-containing protein [Angelakisella sp.]